MVEFDAVLKEIGECGRAQIVQYLLLCLCVFNAGLLSVDVVFFSGKPAHHCALPANLSREYRQAFPNASDADLRGALVPPDDSCQLYDRGPGLLRLANSSNLTEFGAALTASGATAASPCSAWTYSRQYYGQTFVTEFDMVCDRKWIALTIKMLYFGGRLFGAVVLGQLSDIFGRLPVFLLSVALNLIAGVGLFFSRHVAAVAVFIFLHGTVQVGFMLTCFVLGTELVGPKYRKWFGIILQGWYAAAMAILAGVARVVPNWHHLALITSVPSVLFFSYAIIVKESPRWLVTRGRNEEALKILKVFARRNGRTMSAETEAMFLRDKPAKPERLYTVFDLLSTWKRARLTINVWFNWVVNSLVYYGIIFNLNNLGSDPYVSMAILGLVEFPAYAISIPLLDKMGRKRLLLSSLFFAGAFCTICGFVPKDPSWVVTVMAMLGKFGITISYGVIYFMTAELFPTCVRNVAVGMGSTFARVGGLLSNPILSLEDTGHRFLPMLIFGLMSLAAGGLTFLMPETKGQNLRNTFDDDNRKMEPDADEAGEKLVSDGPNGIQQEEKV